jgi:DNA-binding response OmpR family regulator
VKILIIDDEIQVAELLAAAVTQQGHDAMVAHNGKQGLALLARERPDAVFLDIKMQELDGIDVLRRLRSMDATLPVIVITGHAEPSQLDEARRLGVTEVLKKPFILNRLAGALAGLARLG